MSDSNRSDWQRLLFFPTVVFLIIAWLINHFEFDLTVADYLYHWEGGNMSHQWPLRNAFLEKVVLHDYGHHLVVISAVLLLFSTILSGKISWLKPYQKGLVYLLASFVVTVVLIGILKKMTHVNCPWDLLRYGGTQQFIGTFEPLPLNVKPGHCFPGGHATGGYGWIGLFYFCRMYFPKWRWRVLTAVLFVGVIFDMTQQLRGAHFLSHGLWTLAISWWISTLLYLVFYKKLMTKNCH